MVSETVIGAAIGVSGAVIGSLLTGAFHFLSTRQQIDAENTRRHADYFLQQKVDVLTELHAQLEQCHQNYRFNWESVLEMDKDDYKEEILQGFYDFEYAMSRAAIFLDEEQMDTMSEVFDEFRWANGYFHRHILHSTVEGPGEQVPEEYHTFNETEMSEAVESAREVLQEEISQPANYFET